MAKRAMMECPTCRQMARTFRNPELEHVELFNENPEADVFRCSNGHAFPNYMALMEMAPTLIKLVPRETAQPNDVKVEFWIDKTIAEGFKARFPHQQNSTVQSILNLYLTGEYPIIIDGVQARKLNALGIKTGQEMVAALEVSKTVEAQLEGAQSQLALYASMFERAGIQSPVA